MGAKWKYISESLDVAKVMTAGGGEIMTLGVKQEGLHEFRWFARHEGGSQIAAGTASSKSAGRTAAEDAARSAGAQFQAIVTDRIMRPLE